MLKNRLRSDFFIGIVNLDFMYAAASSCCLEGKANTPAGKAEEVRPRRKWSPARKSTAVEQAIHTNSFIPFIRL
ncbi:hypothetical protein [Priestia megaterium]|uniref:hypothetical protein n=1 Tax=Priestia megaterium TaxID=1404 RepID=UPI00285C2FE5|nr:hypothetical protein [Priestia megaterium]MDR7244497.1 hypothetical protein [Priestia megaterium]